MPVIINKDCISVIVAKISHCPIAQRNEPYTFTAMKEKLWTFCTVLIFYLKLVIV